jgi:hypothetical protein
VLLVFCDHANDDGYNARPSIARIAWKTDISDRHIKRIVQELVRKTALRITREASHVEPTTYRVVLTVYPPKPPFTFKKRGDTASPLQIALGVTSETSGVTFPTVGVTFEAGRGDIAMSPKPSVQPSIKPSVQPSSSFSSCADGAANADDGGDKAQEISLFLADRGINEPTRGNLAAKFASLKDGYLWLILEYGRCMDPAKYKHKAVEQRIAMFINRARTKWQSVSTYGQSALTEFVTN